MDEAKRDYIAAWVKKAENDLQNASIILDSNAPEKPYDTVCFHCQQAAEKFLKAYLVRLDIEFPKSHSIAQLLELGAKKEKSLRSLAFADELTPFSADIRYPDDFIQPTKQDAEKAFADAVKVKEFITPRLLQ